MVFYKTLLPLLLYRACPYRQASKLEESRVLDLRLTVCKGYRLIAKGIERPLQKKSVGLNL